MSEYEYPIRNPRIDFGKDEKLEPKKASAEARKMKFGLDMVEAAMAHVEFLSDVDKHPCLYAGEYVQKAISRYENLWLPLAAKNPEERLAAPLDIEWIWHCHLLAPVLYEKDCQKFFQTTVNHKLFRRIDRIQALKRSKHLWEEMYPSEPFEVDLPLGLIDVQPYDRYASKIAYDLTAATSRQCAFFYNVSLPHYLDRKFLSLSEMRYKMFLYLRKYVRDAYLVPCFDNDLMWHTHQLHPIIYKADTQRILGRFFNHDDTTNDRTQGTILWNGTVDTIKLWKEMFGSNYNMAGAMFRGKVSRGLYNKFSGSGLELSSDKKVFLDFETVALERPPDGDYGFDFSIEILTGREDGSEPVCKLMGPDLAWFGDEISQIELPSLDTNLLVSLVVKKGKLLHKNAISCEETLNMGELVSPKSSVHPFYKALHLKGKKAENVLLLKGTIHEAFPEVHLKCVSGEYQTCALPHDLDSSFPVEISDGDPCSHCSACYLARHRLLDDNGRTLLSCRVIHNPHRLLSAFQVYQGVDHHGADPGRLLCTGHLIDSSHLPLPTLVLDQDRMMTLDPGLRERAILIKDNDGDWAVVSGHWKICDPSGKGALYLKFLHCASGLVTHHWFPSGERCPELHIGNCKINFADAVVLYRCHPREIPQYSALSLAVATLFVLCVPRRKDWLPGNKLNDENDSFFSPDLLQLAEACGLHIQTPSNHYRFETPKHEKTHC